MVEIESLTHPEGGGRGDEGWGQRRTDFFLCFDGVAVSLCVILKMFK